MDLDQRFRDADPAVGLEINTPDPALITHRLRGPLGHRARQRPRTGSLLSRIALIVPVLVVVGVVAVVLTLAGRASVSPGTHSTLMPATHPQHRSELAILRRPQTRKDRTFSTVVRRAARLGGLGDGAAGSYLHGVIAHSTRYAQTLPDGREVFLAETHVSGPVASRQPLLDLFVIVPDGTRSDGQGQPIINPGVSVPSNRAARGEALAGPACVENTDLGVMPNGVARVRWQFPRQDHNGYVYPNSLTLDVPVHSNTAVATIPGHASCDLPTVISLYASDGRLIARRGNPAALNRITRPVRHGNPTAGLHKLERHKRR